MSEHLQFPLGSALIVLPLLTGGILAMWSQVFVRREAEAARSTLFWAILVPTMIVGLFVGSSGVWYSPEFDNFGDPYDTRRDFQTSLFVAFAASLVSIPIAVKMAPTFKQAATRLRQRQISLALLVVSAGLAGPLVYFLYSLFRGPMVMLYVGLQFAVFGFILWQLTRPSPAGEEVAHHG